MIQGQRQHVGGGADRLLVAVTDDVRLGAAHDAQQLDPRILAEIIAELAEATAHMLPVQIVGLAVKVGFQPAAGNVVVPLLRAVRELRLGVGFHGGTQIQRNRRMILVTAPGLDAGLDHAAIRAISITDRTAATQHTDAVDGDRGDGGVGVTAPLLAGCPEGRQPIDGICGASVARGTDLGAAAEAITVARRVDDAERRIAQRVAGVHRVQILDDRAIDIAAAAGDLAGGLHIFPDRLRRMHGAAFHHHRFQIVGLRRCRTGQTDKEGSLAGHRNCALHVV